MPMHVGPQVKSVLTEFTKLTGLVVIVVAITEYFINPEFKCVPQVIKDSISLDVTMWTRMANSASRIRNASTWRVSTEVGAAKCVNANGPLHENTLTGELIETLEALGTTMRWRFLQLQPAPTGCKVVTRATRSLGREDILQAVGQTVQKGDGQ